MTSVLPSFHIHVRTCLEFFIFFVFFYTILYQCREKWKARHIRNIIMFSFLFFLWTFSFFPVSVFVSVLFSRQSRSTRAYYVAASMAVTNVTASPCLFACPAQNKEKKKERKKETGRKNESNPKETR